MFENGFPVVAGCTLVMLLLLVVHWFPWERWLGRRMHRLEAYSYGTGSIFLGFLLTAWLYGRLWPVMWLASIMVSGGLAVFVAWGIDWIGIKLAAMRRQARQQARSTGGDGIGE